MSAVPCDWPALRRVLVRLLAGSWLLMLANLAPDMAAVPVRDAWAVAWLAAAWPVWSLAFVLVVLLPVALAGRALTCARVLRWSGTRVRPAVLGLLAVATLGLAAGQLLAFIDARVFRIFGFHANGFVWNLLTTRGGIESMGAGPGLEWACGVAAFLALGLQAGIAAAALRRGPAPERPRRARRTLAVVACVFLLFAFERVTFGLADAANQRNVLAATAAFPLVPPVRMHRFARWLGVERPRGGPGSLEVEPLRLRYPLEPVLRDPQAPRRNVVVLVAESWRADMLDPQVMPRTWELARAGLRFTRHASGGNGTRMGMFSLFYGLHGASWFQFLAENRAPVLLDVLREGGWDIEAFTSARFSFPEFDETLFAGVPAGRLHEGDPALAGWQNDRAQAGALLDSIDRLPAGQPFFRFEFFESPHARYEFPPECAYATPYLEELDYATLDLGRDIGLVMNRYRNACRHLDSQVARVIEGLRDRGLLEDTLVVLTGDHGEEFMEHGRWGHHSDFSDEQFRTPLVLWIPGEPGRVIDAPSCHGDVVPTLMARLGVGTPAVSYCLGRDLLGPGAREDVVVADWDHLALVTGDWRAVFGTGSSAVGGLSLFDRELRPVDDDGPFWERHRGRVRELMDELGRFSR